MKELVSTARIGRSLGIHLILATQKPSGVVDDQIWSNSKFKLSLKVQNTSDSMEILKTPDAAEITLPGRAYLQVGNNEIYELFQSAWSGANYVPDQDDQDMLDTTIYAINDLGQYEPISADLSGLANQKEITKVPTELEAVVDWIHARAKKLGIAQLPKPWLPPLEEQIYLPELHAVDFRECWQNEKTDLEPVIGFADLPEMQEQKVLQLNMAKDGHILIYSSPGYGKSTFLQTTVMDLARVNNPENLHVYLLDFGTNGLLPLKELPHVADTIMIDETEKISKLIRLTSSEIKKRKRRLSQYGVANLKMYEKASKEHVPDLLFVIDNYDAVREADNSDAFEKMITQIAREGASIGLHLVISASRQNAMRMQVLSNIKIQIPLYLIDRTDVRAIVGKTDIEIEEIPGRGIVKLDNPILFQTALPASGTDTLAIIENIQKEAKEMDRFWSGKRPAPIPVMPEVLEFPQFAANPAAKEYAEKGWIPSWSLKM